MAGELHSPPDDGARARADDVDSEQVRADALADRIAAYAPAGSDCRPRVAWSCLACGAASDRQSCARCGAECVPAAVPSVPQLPEMERRALRAEIEVDRLRGMLSAHGLDPDCSLCAAGHVPARPCAEPKP